MNIGREPYKHQHLIELNMYIPIFLAQAEEEGGKVAVPADIWDAKPLKQWKLWFLQEEGK